MRGAKSSAPCLTFSLESSYRHYQTKGCLRLNLQQDMHSVVIDSVHKVFRAGGFFFGRHKTETYALKGVSFNISRGEIFALVGPNGSGKTTTLKLISTVLLPDRGRALINGADTRQDAQRVRLQVGLALASERSFFPRLTVRENLDFFGALENVPRSDRARRITDVLRTLSLEAHAGKQVMKLSSGLNQRLGLARGLIKNPKVLLLDEPSRSLDPSACDQLWDLIRRLAQTGITIILATHNFTEAAIADRMAVLQKGELRGVFSTAGSSIEDLRFRYLQMTSERSVWQEQVPA
jgi:ABC-2 type transport system ATP-binding protein